MILAIAMMLQQNPCATVSGSDNHSSYYTIGVGVATVIGFFLQHWFLKKRAAAYVQALKNDSESNLQELRQNGLVQLEAIKEAIRRTARTSDFRADGLDALLERARKARDGGIKMTQLDSRSQEARKIIADTVMSLQAIAAFLEPIAQEIKFNYLTETDRLLYQQLCDQLANLVITVDPDRRGESEHEIRITTNVEKLGDVFTRFEKHVTITLQPDFLSSGSVQVS